MANLRSFRYLIFFVFAFEVYQVSSFKRIKESCTSVGGSCVRTGSSCSGVVDDYIGGCKHHTACCKPSPLQQPVTSTLKPVVVETLGNGTCGLITILPSRNTDPKLRIVGGDPALEGEWPWQVSFSDSNGHFCGGTLISDEWIISAAHCFTSKTVDDVTVVLGEHNRILASENEISVKIQSWILHPNYSPFDGFPNDIALVKLMSKVDITGNYVRTACLPSLHDVFDETDYCYISGWGYTMGTGDNNYLQHLNVQITPRISCNESWSGDILDSHICIGNGDVGACRGDSGGPLVCLRDGRYIVAGATSWGSLSCQELGLPNVYVQIAKYLPWILEHIRN